LILLHGPSSAGKSTVATALQVSLDEYWWRLEADDVTRIQPTGDRTGWWNPGREERPHPTWDSDKRLSDWYAGYIGCLTQIALNGCDVIGVGAWMEPEWAVRFANAFEGIEAYCVFLHCPLEELERRELARGDRAPGYARSHYELIRAQAPFDLDLDTSACSTAECVVQIRNLLASPPVDTFFARLQAKTPKEHRGP
jgi:chloramphenicol 3-O phosphotransferase